MTRQADVCIGVLALQGSFREHVARLNKLSGVTAVEVRTKQQLEDVDGLVIPGGAVLSQASRFNHSQIALPAVLLNASCWQLRA